MNKQQIIVVVGPTASGKSDFAVNLALANNGEIISADSRQIYKGLDIGTGKITKEEMKGVPHYMLDICDLNDDFSVAEYKRIALPILKDILARGKTSIICGGTGQYIDALIYDQEIPKVEPNKKLREELEKKTTEQLYKELLQKDQRRGEAIDKHNRPRLIRALEIIESLGVVPELTQPSFRFDTKIYLLSPTKEILRERIEKRFDSRVAIGMIEEVRGIVKKIFSLYGKDVNPVIWKKLGLEYDSITKYIEGKITLEEAKQEVITKSVQYAKRQTTWNKKYTPFAEIVAIEK